MLLNLVFFDHWTNYFYVIFSVFENEFSTLIFLNYDFSLKIFFLFLL